MKMFYYDVKLKPALSHLMEPYFSICATRLKVFVTFQLVGIYMQNKLLHTKGMVSDVSFSKSIGVSSLNRNISLDYYGSDIVLKASGGFVTFTK